ncbi:MAG: sulfatase-like hydrolase/transferase, partial [Bacteroidetes bacterium]|nr:sulfatase-like hydrolase/transferase [Bacteroidota bacterium]
IDTTGNNIDTTGNNIDTTATTQRPNIILIIADDMSQKTFIETGGPAWFETPSISRIANEGINFMEATVTLSLCAPSRATIFTGLYANHTGVTANQGERIDSNLLTMAKVLHDAGYYTGFIGKYHVASMPQPGYDFWLAGVNSFYGNNPKFNLNGNMVTMDENFTTVVQENVNEFIRTAPRPFFLIAAHVAPHAPYLVQPQDEGRYDDEVMPFPQDFYKYTHNFPDFLYPSNQINITDSANLTEDIKGYFESTAGIEHSTDTMLSIMDSLGITDSSMIIFTSDNGYLFGEHQLFCKRLSYEESLKVPMFIRYPQWFTPHTVDTTTLALNVDLCPTILDAAGIPDTFHFDGKSLHYLLQNPAARTQTLFQYDYNSYGDGTNIPSFRGIRSLDYKYVRYSCEDQTEEFFDERNDPLELTNLINDSSYTSLIEHYRHLLDSSMQSLGDTNALVVRNCYLNTTQERVMDSEEGDEEGEAMTFRVYPQPAKDNVFFELRNLPTEQGKITYVINNAKGEFLTRKDLFYVGKNFRDVIDIASLVPGVYMVKISDGMSVFTSKLTVGH